MSYETAAILNQNLPYIVTLKVEFHTYTNTSSNFCCKSRSRRGERFKIQANRAYITRTFVYSVGQSCFRGVDRRKTRILNVGAILIYG